MIPSRKAVRHQLPGRRLPCELVTMVSTRMSKTDLARLSVADFTQRFRAEMVPFSNTFSYFCAGLPLTEEDVKEYLEEPISALPPNVVRSLPKTGIFLVPFLERANGKEKRHGPAAPPGSREFVTLEKPAENRGATHVALRSADVASIVFAVKDLDLADYHYRFYQQIAVLAESALSADAHVEFNGLLREELSANIHGEVDEQSWHHKQALRRRGTNIRRDSKAFREYARHAFTDTMTLYLHGICCDIDVDTDPRQLASRYLRKRLVWLEGAFPPPSGYCVFPEELDETKPARK